LSTPILHHFDPSPFAEKVRLVLGLKGLAWQSVQLPMIMPKPDLTALTGGYRKTPVLQFGADIYCDTRLIVLELERRFPSPTLFPGGSEGLALALGSWSDRLMFRAGAALSLGTNEALPAPVRDDRMAFFDFLDDSDLGPGLDHHHAQFLAGLRQLDAMLADGRPWLLGHAPGWADLACYTSVWMCRGNIAGAGDLLDPLALLCAWEQRVAGLGHGERDELDAGAALALARESSSAAEAQVLSTARPRFRRGDRVAVAPDDYGMDPVSGELLRLTHDDIVVARSDPRAGAVVVHFPRLGYRVTAAPADGL
jgi:glutathione S-transferase